MTFEKQTTQTAPNKTYYYADWSCRNGGTTSSINPFPYSGVIYGLVCFPVGLFIRKREEAKLETECKVGEFHPHKNKSRLPKNLHHTVKTHPE